ncbi:baseplate J/gp47 family protein [Tengunoibacter tsumagoiensis]|uniref:Baseplate protein J-like barrel domain-containing protein n=1 Tax=Tengunoibacter tsumagoiensis TaxID=2014871 RepID=A0A401ZTL6_9CHLR|nr:baseplate J/gp47 family protein [Tengunoibacter tsumagoiensis]GCE10207.1 hypothetical protein KTT_00660 [Tengunoibacter tsumagoiensis]
MSDEQTIYISPDDDLTTVRERLEKISSRGVTLVIPLQTQLRSHVAWKLLYARARELGKDVLIVSSDPQVRSVAHAVKFKVAHSLESTTAGKSRPASRATRPPHAGGPRSKPLSGRATPPRGPQDARGVKSTRNRQPEPQSDWYPTETPSGSEEPGQHYASSPTYDTERQFSQGYDFQISSSPSIRPLSSEQIEEPDLLLEDYTQAQDILQAASGSMKVPKTPTSTPEGFVEEKGSGIPHSILPIPSISNDPFDYMADEQPAIQGEQRGSASIEGFDTVEHVIEEVPDLPIHLQESGIEFQGEDGHFSAPPPSGENAWSEPIPEAEEDEEPGIRHIRPLRGRSARRGGYTPPARSDAPRAPQKPAVPQTPLSQQEIPVEIDDFPTRMQPPAAAARPPAGPRPAQPKPPSQSISGQLVPPSQMRSGPLIPSSRRSGQLKPAEQPRPAQIRPSGKLPPKRSTLPLDPRTAAALNNQRPAARHIPPPAPRKRRPVRQSSNRRIVFPILAVAIILLIAVAVLAYYGPSSTVNLTVSARDYSHDVSLLASTKNPANALPTQLLSKDFTKDGTAAATGSKQIDRAIAHGYVCFSNASNTTVHIPSALILTTANGTQFQTQEDTVILPNYTCGADDPYKIQIQAVKPGEAGNVGAGTITIIPDDSLNAIARSQNSPTAAKDLKITVNNEKAITGGGVQPVPAVSAQDLDKAKSDLHAQLQASIDAWTKQVAANGLIGTPVTTDTLTTAPKEGDIEESGSFPVTLTIHTNVLYVTTRDLQQAAVQQLNTAIHADKAYTNYSVFADPKSPVKIDQLQTANADTTSMTLKFHATSKAVPSITADDIKHRIAGHSFTDARAILHEAIPDLQQISIQSNPAFVSWVVYPHEHITVTIQAGTAPKK